MRRAPLHRWPWRVGDAPGRLPVAEVEHRARLEERDVGRAAPDVAAQGGEKPWEQRGAHAGLLVRERVGEQQEPATVVVRGHPERVEVGVADEGVGERLDVACGGERATDATTRTLGLGEPVPGTGLRQGRRDGVVPAEAQHLLDQVGRVGEVGTPGRRGDDEDVGPGVGDGGADGLEPLDDDRARDVDTGDAGGQVDGHLDGDGLARGLDPGHADVAAAAVLDEQGGGPRGGVRREHGVDAALEPPRGLARELVAARHARDDGRGEVRGLERDVDGVVVDLGVEPAHRAGETDRSAVVGDEEVVARRGCARRGRGSRASPPRGHGARRSGPGACAVERVQRLARLEHDVVGDVDRERDRAHAAHDEPAAHPAGRRRLRVEADDRAQREEAAAVEVVDRALVRRPRIGCREVVDIGRVAQRHAVLVRELARHAAHRQAVAAVGGDRDVEDDVAETEHGAGVGSELGGALGQHHDAVVVVAETELALGADHAVGDLAVGLARARCAKSPGSTAPGSATTTTVAHDEVARAADDAAHARVSGGRAPTST